MTAACRRRWGLVPAVVATSETLPFGVLVNTPTVFADAPHAVLTRERSSLLNYFMVPDFAAAARSYSRTCHTRRQNIGQGLRFDRQIRPTAAICRHARPVASLALVVGRSREVTAPPQPAGVSPACAVITTSPQRRRHFARRLADAESSHGSSGSHSSIFRSGTVLATTAQVADHDEPSHPTRHAGQRLMCPGIRWQKSIRHHWLLSRWLTACKVTTGAPGTRGSHQNMRRRAEHPLMSLRLTADPVTARGSVSQSASAGALRIAHDWRRVAAYRSQRLMPNDGRSIVVRVTVCASFRMRSGDDGVALGVGAVFPDSRVVCPGHRRCRNGSGDVPGGGNPSTFGPVGRSPRMQRGVGLFEAGDTRADTRRPDGHFDRSRLTVVPDLPVGEHVARHRLHCSGVSAVVGVVGWPLLIRMCSGSSRSCCFAAAFQVRVCGGAAAVEPIQHERLSIPASHVVRCCSAAPSPALNAWGSFGFRAGSLSCAMLR